MSDTLAVLVDHGKKPRNMGRLGDADAIGNVGSIVVGRALRFFIKVTDEIINEAKFQVFACPEMVASTSLLTEWVIGKTLDEAISVSAEDLADLWQIPREQLPFQLWGLEALRDAVRRQREQPMPYESVGMRSIVCRCHGIDEITIQTAINDGADSFETVSKQTKAGTGCGSCRRDIEELLNAGRKSAPVGSGGGKIIGRIQVMKQIDAALGPILADLGAEQKVSLWDFAGGVLQLKVSGAFANDGPEQKGLLERVDRALKDDIDPTLRVELYSEG